MHIARHKSEEYQKKCPVSSSLGTPIVGSSEHNYAVSDNTIIKNDMVLQEGDKNGIYECQCAQ
jgi:hypothetical protein